MAFNTDMNIKTCTELRLGLPGTSDEYPNPPSSTRSNKRDFPSCSDEEDEATAPPPPKAQIVGWPPVRAYRRNNAKKDDVTTYVKVSMDGAPYLRKIDLKIYESYQELLKALDDMFKIGVGKYNQKRESEYVPTYEDKDGDWMLVGDVPWK